MSGLLQNYRVWLAAGVLLMNVTAFFLMRLDKRRSKRRGARRVPEKMLFLIALLGGSLGALWGMLFYHHKTKHWYFIVGLPVILILQVVLITYLILK